MNVFGQLQTVATGALVVSVSPAYPLIAKRLKRPRCEPRGA